MSGRFVYLGKHLIRMDNQLAKENVMEVLEIVISKSDTLPLYPKNKITIVTVYAYSKIK